MTDRNCKLMKTFWYTKTGLQKIYHTFSMDFGCDEKNTIRAVYISRHIVTHFLIHQSSILVKLRHISLKPYHLIMIFQNTTILGVGSGQQTCVRIFSFIYQSENVGFPFAYHICLPFSCDVKF